MYELTYTNRYGVTRQITNPLVIGLYQVWAVIMMVFGFVVAMLMTLLTLFIPFLLMLAWFVVLPFDLLLKLFKRRGFIRKKRDQLMISITSKSFKRQKR